MYIGFTGEHNKLIRDYNNDWVVEMTTNLCICIPRIDRFVTKTKIQTIIEKYKLGSIKRVDITGYGSRRRAFIHFNFWNVNESRTKNIYDTLNDNGHVNIIHSFPWYWRCVKSKFDPQY